MSAQPIIPNPDHDFNCPGCGAEHTIPASSIFRQPVFVRDEVLVMGTCTECGTTSTLWQERTDGTRLPESE